MTEPMSIVPGTVDRIRVIRRSIRCFYFGCIGAIPLVGMGLAIQAMRLHREVLDEMGRGWKAPTVQWYWFLGVIWIAAYQLLFGWPAATAVALVFFGLQTYHLWRSLPVDHEDNPADRHLRWGVVLGYGGIFETLAALELLVFALKEAAS